MVVAVIAATWFALALAVGLVIAGAIRVADRHAPFTDHLIGLPETLTVADVLGARSAQPSH